MQSEYESSQATAQLKLGDSAPVMSDTFKDQTTVESGASISLRCAASASPLPQIKWYLDDQSISAMSGRYRLGDYVTHNGHVISFVNISAVRVIDGGEVSTAQSVAFEASFGLYDQHSEQESGASNQYAHRWPHLPQAIRLHQVCQKLVDQSLSGRPVIALY